MTIVLWCRSATSSICRVTFVIGDQLEGGGRGGEGGGGGRGGGGGVGGGGGGGVGVECRRRANKYYRCIQHFVF